MAKIKILLVDDEPDFIKLIGTRIQSWGYDLIKATNGKEAITKIRDQSPDLVILDYVMPEMDGISVLQKIREHDRKIAVIMLTAHPDADALKWCEKRNACAFISKLSPHSDIASSLKLEIEKAEKTLKGKKTPGKQTS